MREIQFSGPAKYVYASEAEAEIRKAYERGREAAEKSLAEKIADLESQIESLQVIIDRRDDRVKDLEDNYQRIITEVLKLNPLPACEYGDQLEPPWEVIKRTRLRLEKLEAVRKVAEKIRSDDPYLSGSKVVIELEQALREAK